MENILLPSFLSAALLICFTPVATSFIEGSISRCEKEGKVVHVPLISDNPCITCVCKNKEVSCRREQCQPLEGCHMVLFEKPADACCDVCGGCFYKGKSYKSGKKWISEDDGCVQLQCRAGVVTKSKQECHVTCKNPVTLPGECCPICKGCSVEGRKYKEGEEFSTKKDPCVQCTCQGGNVKCVKSTCPVLNCPPHTIYRTRGECCPKCNGHRKVTLPGSRCYFRNNIYSEGKSFQLDNCTRCACKNATVICDRQSCPVLNCPKEDIYQPKNSCCKKCEESPKRKCKSDGQTYKHGAKWQPRLCTHCSCNDGTTHCTLVECKHALGCPKGYKLSFDKDQCCPRCIEADAVCTVFGDPHYRTFDGKIYNFQGTCKYILAEDRTKDRSFSIKVRNDARQTTRFAWTQTVIIKYNKTKINLQQNGVIRVNRKVISIPYTKAGSFVVHREGHSVVMELQNGMEIVWDGDSFLEVTVPSRYKGKLRGLCGNYNGIEADDFTGRDGISYLNAEEFGRTWRSGSKRACKIRPQVRNLESPCQSNFKTKLHAHKKCQVLTSALFLSCHRKVDVRSYYRSCVTDMCDCPSNKICACESIRAYGRACSREGVSIAWEQEVPCQEQNCPEGAIYDECGPVCSRTCSDINKIQDCVKPCQPGCFCPAGKVLHQNKCISIRDCPFQ